MEIFNNEDVQETDKNQLTDKHHCNWTEDKKWEFAKEMKRCLAYMVTKDVMSSHLLGYTNRISEIIMISSICNLYLFFNFTNP